VVLERLEGRSWKPINRQYICRIDKDATIGVSLDRPLRRFLGVQVSESKVNGPSGRRERRDLLRQPSEILPDRRHDDVVACRDRAIARNVADPRALEVHNACALAVSVLGESSLGLVRIEQERTVLACIALSEPALA